jgi:hypothetical protein
MNSLKFATFRYRMVQFAIWCGVNLAAAAIYVAGGIALGWF